MAKENIEVPKIKGKSKNGKETSYRIKEIENGFVIERSMEWKDKEGHFKHESKEFFVEDNPIKKEAENMYDIMTGAIGGDETEM